jgi:hypothetical protein
MTDLATTDPAEAPSQPLRDALVRAWNAATWAIPPQAWLDAAATALTATPPASDPHDHGQPADLTSCNQQAVAELRCVHAATRMALGAARNRRHDLESLRTFVRQRAIDTLDDNPGLTDTLREALTDWSLPPIPTDFTVEVTVPMTVRVSAADAHDARRAADTLLRQRMAGLGYEVSADTDALVYGEVSNE